MFIRPTRPTPLQIFLFGSCPNPTSYSFRVLQVQFFLGRIPSSVFLCLISDLGFLRKLKSERKPWQAKQLQLLKATWRLIFFSLIPMINRVFMVCNVWFHCLHQSQCSQSSSICGFFLDELRMLRNAHQVFVKSPKRNWYAVNHCWVFSHCSRWLFVYDGFEIWVVMFGEFAKWRNCGLVAC